MMTRITLDLAQLLRDGQISQEEADRLKGMAVTGKAMSILANLLCIFGALALAGGVVALKPEPSTGLLLAVFALMIAVFVRYKAFDEWRVLGDGMAIAGTFGICGWFGLEFGEELGALTTNTLLTGFVLAATVFFRQAFLAAFIPIGIGMMLGSGTAYWHASYGLFVREATMSVVVFTLIAILLYVLLEKVRNSSHAIWENVVLIPARVSFFMINFAFWVGSLWGDWIGEHFRRSLDGTPKNYEALKEWREMAWHVDETVFSIGWLVFLSAAIVLGLKKHNRFLVNTAIVFLGIHFYTQFHEYFGFNPGSLVIGGLFLLVCAVGLFRFNRWQVSQRA